MMKIVRIILLLSIINYCYASKFIIKSEPSEAEVIIQSAEGGERFKLGVTPIEVDHSQIDAITKGLAFKIELTKNNYESNKILVASLGKEDIIWNSVLVPSVADKGLAEIDSLINGMFEAQRLVRAKDFRGALYQLEVLEKKFPNISSIYETKGSIHYLNKNFNIALADYRKAFSLNPTNTVALQMKLYLEDKLNLKDKK